VDGIAYWSRIDSSERCWAIYGHVPVDVAIGDLSVDDPVHREAVRAAATLLKVPITARLAVMPQRARTRRLMVMSRLNLV
jgi:hypothetical protein